MGTEDDKDVRKQTTAAELMMMMGENSKLPKLGDDFEMPNTNT